MWVSFVFVLCRIDICCDLQLCNVLVLVYFIFTTSFDLSLMHSSQNFKLLPVLCYCFVCVIRCIANRKYTIFYIHSVRLSTDNITLIHWIKILTMYCYKWSWLTVGELSIIDMGCSTIFCVCIFQLKKKIEGVEVSWALGAAFEVLTEEGLLRWPQNYLRSYLICVCVHVQTCIIFLSIVLAPFFLPPKFVVPWSSKRKGCSYDHYNITDIFQPPLLCSYKVTEQRACVFLLMFLPAI